MVLGYSLKTKAYRCFNYRTKKIVECTNVRIDEKFGTKKKLVDCNYDEEDNNSKIVRQNAEVLFETNNDLQNYVFVEHREDQWTKPREEIRVEISTPTSSKNMKNYHPPKKIIGNRDK